MTKIKNSSMQRSKNETAKNIPTLKELAAQITPTNRYPEVDWGSDAGREKVEWRVATARRVRRRPSPD
jgi:antitoxin component of MazEF toxin-antitoxin module